MRRRVARVGTDCHLERRTRLVVLTLCGEQHGKIVVRFRQLREIIGERLEHLDRIRGLVLLGEDEPLQEPCTGVLGTGLQERIDAVERLGVGPGTEELLALLHLVCAGVS